MEDAIADTDTCTPVTDADKFHEYGIGNGKTLFLLNGFSSCRDRFVHPHPSKAPNP